MVNAKDVVSHPLRAIDAIGYPFVRVAHSRKVMKGEDKSFASPDVVWTPARVDGDGAEGCSASPPPSSCHFSVFGLFDGHGGKAAAEHCAETLVPCILDALDARVPIARDDDAEDALEERLPAALVDAFAASDAQFLLKDIHSGATATIVCVNGRCVTSAAVGDSLATIDTGSQHHHNSTKSSGGASSASRLTPEHRLDTSASERNRIEAAGGEVRATAFEEGKPVGPLRVWPGGLAVSRSMGDRDGKKGGAFYLTPVPIRPRSRGERLSLRTFPGVSVRPGSLAFNPDTPRRLSTPSDAFQLHPDRRDLRAGGVSRRRARPSAGVSHRPRERRAVGCGHREAGVELRREARDAGRGRGVV